MTQQLIATREVLVLKTNKAEIETKYFDLWLMPSKECKKVLQSNNPFKTYKEWVMSIDSKEIIPIYEDEDEFGEFEPIAYDEIDYSSLHLDGLETWILQMEEEGYDIKFSITDII